MILRVCMYEQRLSSGMARDDVFRIFVVRDFIEPGTAASRLPTRRALNGQFGILLGGTTMTLRHSSCGLEVESVTAVVRCVS